MGLISRTQVPALKIIIQAKKSLVYLYINIWRVAMEYFINIKGKKLVSNFFWRRKFRGWVNPLGLKCRCYGDVWIKKKLILLYPLIKKSVKLYCHLIYIHMALQLIRNDPWKGHYSFLKSDTRNDSFKIETKLARNLCEYNYPKKKKTKNITIINNKI